MVIFRVDLIGDFIVFVVVVVLLLLCFFVCFFVVVLGVGGGGGWGGRILYTRCTMYMNIVSQRLNTRTINL